MRKRELCSILSQIRLSDTTHESQGKINSSFQPISYIAPQNLLYKVKEKWKDHFIRQSKKKLEDDQEEPACLSSIKRFQINKME